MERPTRRGEGAIELQRAEIIRSDFPTSRRGYDRAAVDAHLRALADAVEERERVPVAAATGDQVRAILAAAETSADELRAVAEREAEAIRAGAEAERAAAMRGAGGRLEEVAKATDALVRRLDALAAEVGETLSAIRAEAGELAADVERLQGEVRAGEHAAAPPAAADVKPEAEDSGQPGAGPDAAPEPAGGEDAGEIGAGGDAGDGGAPKAPAGNGTEEDPVLAGARIVALNMALSGTDRDETDRFLAEHFKLDDRAALVDEVYARAKR